MSGVPHVYTPEKIIEDLKTNLAGLSNGRWVTARPCPYPGICLRRRFYIAWMVFTGKWDALRWTGQTEEDKSQI